MAALFILVLLILDYPGIRNRRKWNPEIVFAISTEGYGPAYARGEIFSKRQ
ncbi:hypothetical protein ASZ90_007253 [hydrocarbon metagenome]|uniref:Uncharacterized protein n=1 Tax=hydrocarbon metagenome TaxID=938273 RepID=A0A0W8FPX0_9ZZZZ